LESLQIGDIKLTWLHGGVTHLDGGAMFGVVPKVLWSKKYPANDLNQIELRTDPILVETGNKRFLLESGIGSGKLTDKERRNYGVSEESKIKESLKELGLTPKDIDGIIMTHMHFDHAAGLTEPRGTDYQSVFPMAKIYCSEVEWDEMRNPNIRSRNTYWEKNWKAIQSQVVTFKEELEIHPSIRIVHTGGHSQGHSIVIFHSKGEMAIHLADLLPTHAHRNPLWVMAYDDYPMDSIREKEKWLPYGVENNAWFTFYHDAFYRAVKWDSNGNFTASVRRERAPMY